MTPLAHYQPFASAPTAQKIQKSAFTLWYKVRFAPFFFAEKHPPASLLLLFRKKARSALLFACKRALDASLSLPPFCECECACGAKKIRSQLSLFGTNKVHFAPFFAKNRRSVCVFSLDCRMDVMIRIRAVRIKGSISKIAFGIVIISFGT